MSMESWELAQREDRGKTIKFPRVQYPTRGLHEVFEETVLRQLQVSVPKTGRIFGPRDEKHPI